MNSELNKISVWLRNNKIFFNISKTNYVLIDEYINTSMNENSEINLQPDVINRVRNLKYLGMLIDQGWANCGPLDAWTNFCEARKSLKQIILKNNKCGRT